VTKTEQACAHYQTKTTHKAVNYENEQASIARLADPYSKCRLDTGDAKEGLSHNTSYYQ
jgi:hypothetical protein